MLTAFDASLQDDKNKKPRKQGLLDMGADAEAAGPSLRLKQQKIDQPTVVTQDMLDEWIMVSTRL